MINWLRNTKVNPIVLNAGDNFQGSLYYYFFKWKIVKVFMDRLQFDAMVN